MCHFIRELRTKLPKIQVSIEVKRTVATLESAYKSLGKIIFCNYGTLKIEKLQELQRKLQS